MTQIEIQLPKKVDPAEAAILQRRLAKAKTSLILEHPFIGNIALNLPTVVTYDVPTAATNGAYIKYNPDFCRELDDDQLKFLVAHECMHPMLEHPFRLHGREPMKFNKAADYVINHHLNEQKIGTFIKGGCLDVNIYNAGGGSTDGIYKILPDEPEGGGGNGPGGTGNDLQQAPGTEAERQQMADEWKVMVAQAMQAAKMMGKMPVGMERLVEQMLNPKVDWREVLRRFVQKCRTDMRSFARPNRRFIQQGFYMPVVTGEAIGEIVFAIDCSGSIGQEELDQFAAEIFSVKEETNPVRIHLIYFDSEVSHVGKFERDDELHVEMHGGGGTAFSPVFEKIEELAIEPVACIFLTDLCCSDFGPAPDYPVLWVSTMDGKAPFGEVVLM